jgi:hypothetical protein
MLYSLAVRSHTTPQHTTPVPGRAPLANAAGVVHTPAPRVARRGPAGVHRQP